MNIQGRVGSNPIAHILVALCLAAFSCVAVAGEPSQNPTSMSFAAGGTIRMKIAQGTVEVVGVSDEKITISWDETFPFNQRLVRVKLQRSGAKDSTLSLDGPSEHVRYRIEVPRQSNLSINMGIGELGVRGITGSLNAELLAGEMDLHVADSSRYRNVRASVLAGEITARPWKIDIGGLVRSFNASGDGEYDLRAELLAGEITIRSD